MSYAEPDASGYTPHPSELSPKDFAVRPSDSTQDLCFRSIKAINRAALQPSGNVPERRTPKGIRPAVYTMYNASQTAIIFEVMLHTGQTVQCHVPADSWRLATCDPENVRAAIQKAYLFFLQGKKDPVVVRPGMMSLGLIPFAEHQRSKSLGTHGHGHGHGSRHTTTRYYTPAARHESYQSYSSDSTALTYTIPQYSNPTSPAGQAVGVPLQYNNYSGAYTVQYVPGVAVQPPQQKLKKRWWTLQ